jgi:deazaflavin-dependent oxidoreductase (nitroreductase family)
MALIFENGFAKMPSPNLPELLSRLSKQKYCYLTTKGRVTGQLHEIEIWFGTNGENIYLLSGGGLDSDWVKNLLKESRVQVRIGKINFEGIAKLIEDPGEDQLARELLAGKYYHWKKGKKMNEWARTAAPVRIKLST